MKPTPASLLIVACCCLLAPHAGRAEFAPPERKPLNYYLENASRNPFGVASKKEAVVTQAGFAKNLYINGIMDFDGEQTVYIADKNKKSVFSLGKGQAHDGIELVEVEMHPTVGSSTVIIRKGSETAKLTFDQAQMFSGTGMEIAAANPKQNSNNAASPAQPERRARPTTLRKPRPVRIIRAPKKGQEDEETKGP